MSDYILPPKLVQRYSGWLRGILIPKPRNIRSVSTHIVTGRRTIKVCALSDGPFIVDQPLVIDGLKWTIAGIENTSPPGEVVGLIVRVRTK